MASSDTPLFTTPTKIKVFVRDGSVIIRRPWLNVFSHIVLILTLSWSYGTWFCLTQGFGEGKMLLGPLGVLMALLSLPLALFCLSLYLNSTCIRITVDSVSIQHGPLPWFPGPSIPVEEIVSVFHRASAFSHDAKGASMRELICMDAKQREHRLLEGISDTQIAERITQRIRSTLGLD